MADCILMNEIKYFVLCKSIVNNWNTYASVRHGVSTIAILINYLLYMSWIPIFLRVKKYGFMIALFLILRV